MSKLSDTRIGRIPSSGKLRFMIESPGRVLGEGECPDSPPVPPWSAAVCESSELIQPRVVGDVLDRHDGLDLPSAEFGHGMFPGRQRIEVAEDEFGGGGQDQPRALRQLVLEL